MQDIPAFVEKQGATSCSQKPHSEAYGPNLHPHNLFL
jgi:hypothetical protein